ncbi:MAG: DUF1841 family protein [Gammaproteobacteria bacterium]
MLFGQDRQQLRQFFINVWHKYRSRVPLEPLEDLVAGVIQEHPEYHALLESGEAALGRDYLPEMGETNPFLHMGMHIAIREQLASGRPVGLETVHRELALRLGDTHAAEHRIMECLAETLWQAQRAGVAPDEPAYMDCLRRLART